MQQSPDGKPAEGWANIWQGRDSSVWYVLTASEFKIFPLEQLARNWAAGKGLQA